VTFVIPPPSGIEARSHIRPRTANFFPAHFRACKEALMITQVLANRAQRGLVLSSTWVIFRQNNFELTLGILRIYLRP